MSYTTNYCLEYDLYLDRSAACGICVENAYFLQFLLLLSLIPVSVLTSSWLVAKFVYQPHMRQVALEKDWSDFEEDEEEEEEIYEDKYCLDFIRKNDEKKNHKNLLVHETTPDGGVFMKWNEENESFDYWCDNKEVKYVYLEVVARKYCTMFACPEIYIDRKEDIRRQKELEKEEKEKANMEEEDKKEEEVDSDDELFAKLKKPQEVKKSIEKKKTEIAAVRSNKYKRLGNISSMVLLHKVKLKEEPKKKMTFTDWVSFSKNSKTV